mmetsp:Transcript_15279/g.23790  ORF Transcript_15279/g.23790 Transcript_15279/m.23790 type:complete len:432 (+) Transcript_15279:165-1460(+)
MMAYRHICSILSVILLASVYHVQNTQASFVGGLTQSAFTQVHHVTRSSKNHKRPFLAVAMSSETEEEMSASTLRSMTFANLDKDKEPQLLVEFLMEVGACSTAITDADRDTPLEQAIYSEPGDDPWARQNAAVVCGDAAVGTNVWNRCNVTAHFPASFDLKGIATMVEECLDIPLDFDVERVPDRDWVVHVQQSWTPIVVSNMVLRFPWHSDEDVKDALSKVDVDESSVITELKLEGGIAFGTGEHPTTQMCLSWIQQQVPLHQGDTGMKIMDYGAGSGVLGLAACALDTTVTAVGVDIDADAVRIANANADTNGLAMINYLPPLEETTDSESKSVLMKAHQKEQFEQEILPVEQNGPYYDACVANILAGPLVILAPTLASLVKPGGGLGLSGVLAPQADMVVEAYAEYFDNVQVEQDLNNWVLITGTRKA